MNFGATSALIITNNYNYGNNRKQPMSVETLLR